MYRPPFTSPLHLLVFAGWRRALEAMGAFTRTQGLSWEPGPIGHQSADIARHNFEAVGQGEGRARLEERILAILRARDDAYDRSR